MHTTNYFNTPICPAEDCKVVAPTYQKTARKPDIQRKTETREAFESRKRAVLLKPTIRTVGCASHPELSKQNSFYNLRVRMWRAVEHLGIEYGDD